LEEYTKSNSAARDLCKKMEHVLGLETASNKPPNRRNYTQNMGENRSEKNSETMPLPS